jgi:hypothetical protein
VAETTVRRLLCCGFRRTGKATEQVYQCWLRIRREINVFFSGSNITCFTFLYQFVTYLLDLPPSIYFRYIILLKQFCYSILIYFCVFGLKEPKLSWGRFYFHPITWDITTLCAFICLEPVYTATQNYPLRIKKTWAGVSSYKTDLFLYVLS